MPTRTTAPWEYPVLSIKQPWAQLILEGRKTVEVRSWATRYRGPLWIHTGRKVDAYAMDRFHREELWTGGIIGSAILWGIRPFCSASWEAWRSLHLDDAPFDEQLGKYGWILKDPRPLSPPLEVKGATGLFNLERDAFATMAYQAHARNT